MKKSFSILKEYWGYDQFRPLQEDIIDSLAEGKDVLALLPTGGGKSICFQVPALMTEGLCLVISPLIALMKDQVERLNDKGIDAIAIHSGMSYGEVRDTLRKAIDGACKFLYVSPERLESRVFEEFLPALDISLIAVDEAHCISQWGYDFRPSYLKIAKIREVVPDVPVIALTASATLDVQNDICEKLLFRKSNARFQQSFARPNLAYTAYEPDSIPSDLIKCITTESGCAIVYGRTRKQVEQIAALLKQHGIRADFYHAGLSHEERNKRQQKWIENNTIVMVCTNAFGMGIDKPDVRLVIHTSIPDSIENYYQEAGRAGRDGNPSKAILLYDNKESESLRSSVSLRFADYATLKKLYVDLMNHLQVAAGSGEGSGFDFDLNSFTTHFKWNMLQATYGLQTLAQEELFFISDGIFRGSRLGFSAGKEQILEFEKMYPSAEPIIKGLLRCYEGIFDRMVQIQETRLAKFISTPIEIVRQQLHFLNQHNIIQYEPASDKPRIVLLRNRMYADDFRLDLKNHETRKQKYSERIEAMLGFVFDKETCRSKMIGHYFNDKQISDCGVCDNCRQKKLPALSNKIFKEINDTLIVLLSEKPLSFSDIRQKLSNYKMEHLNEVINFLTESQKIESDKFGNLRII